MTLQIRAIPRPESQNLALTMPLPSQRTMTLQIRAIPRRVKADLTEKIQKYHDITNPGNPQTTSVARDAYRAWRTMTLQIRAIPRRRSQGG